MTGLNKAKMVKKSVQTIKITTVTTDFVQFHIQKVDN